ncbi:MAG: multidrug effflux MFS transporter [Proteobacteria bacterium]|nr:multidrug effflux MFS transporter [Pseudomonadota bacterium]
MLKPGHPALTLLLGALIAITPVAMDLYLAALPSMAAALGTTPARAQLTLSLYMYALGVAQLVGGPVSDRWGRRPTLLVSLACFAVASAVCAMAQTVEVLIAARIAQAIAGAASATVPRAVVRDLYSGTDAAHMLSLMGIVLGMAPIVAPFVGAQLFALAGWRAPFVVVAAFGALLLVAVAAQMPETLRDADHRATHPRAMLANFGRLLHSRTFVRYGLTASFGFCGLFAFLAGSAFVFVTVLGRGETGFGLLFGAVMLGNLTGSVLSSRYGRRIGIDRVIGGATWAALVAGVAMAASAWAGFRSPVAIVVPMFVYMVALMMIVPQAMAGALTPFPAIAGAASSLLQFVQFTLASTSALVVGMTFDHTERPMATAIAVSAVLGFAAFRLLRPRGTAGA